MSVVVLVFYSLFLYLISPYLLLRLLWKSRNNAAYKERIKERFSWNNPAPLSHDLWVHAVSLGEAIACSALIETLLTKNYKLLITTTTPTGSQHIQTRFGKRVTHCYLPYDFPYALKRFYKTYQPKLGIIMETEIWPGLIIQAQKQNIPLLLINARLSYRSLASYQKLHYFFASLLNKFNKIYGQSEQDAQRFITLGANPTNVCNGGNIKFDQHIEKSALPVLLPLKMLWGADRVVVIAASTHDNEEHQILSAFPKLQNYIPNCLLLIAPRHPERFQTVFELSRSLGFNTGLRSRPTEFNSEHAVIVLDCLGELLNFYALADYAFVGGSLVAVGGHNMLEPIAFDIPVFTGPQLYNFKNISEELLAENALVVVPDADTLMMNIMQYNQDAVQKKQLVGNAAQVLQRNKGALGFYINQIEMLFNKFK